MGCFVAKSSKQVVPVTQSYQPSAPVAHVKHQKKPVCAAGCGKPSWDGQVGSYCSRSCRAAGHGAPGAVGGSVGCAAPGCPKPSWNGQPGEYCSKGCKAAAGSGSGGPPLCTTPGCGKPTWNGQHGEYCSKSCKANGGAAAGAPCANPGCNQQSWNGQPGDYCGKSCRSACSGSPLCVTPGCGKPSWNGQPGGYCSRTCKNPGQRGAAHNKSTCTLLVPGTQKYDSFKKQYDDKWDTNRCQPTQIRAIYEVNQRSDLFDDFHNSCNSIGNVKCFGHGTNPGNVQRRFHGTKMTCRPGDPWAACTDPKCSVCRVIEDGFSVGKLGSWSGNKGYYGGGLYFTSMSSTAKGYGLQAGYAFDKGNWMDPAAGNAVLIVNIACGRVENVKNTCNHALDTSQFESRKVDKASGADELIVFKAEQALVRAVIVF